jgi:hypothetical protein
MDSIFITMMKNAVYIADRAVMGMGVYRPQPENMFMGMVEINASTADQSHSVWDASTARPVHMKNNLL